MRRCSALLALAVKAVTSITPVSPAPDGQPEHATWHKHLLRDVLSRLPAAGNSSLLLASHPFLPPAAEAEAECMPAAAYLLSLVITQQRKCVQPQTAFTPSSDQGLKRRQVQPRTAAPQVSCMDSSLPEWLRLQLVSALQDGPLLHLLLEPPPLCRPLVYSLSIHLLSTGVLDSQLPRLRDATRAQMRNMAGAANCSRFQRDAGTWASLEQQPQVYDSTCGGGGMARQTGRRGFVQAYSSNGQWGLAASGGQDDIEVEAAMQDLMQLALDLGDSDNGTGAALVARLTLMVLGPMGEMASSSNSSLCCGCLPLCSNAELLTAVEARMGSR